MLHGGESTRCRFSIFGFHTHDYATHSSDMAPATHTRKVFGNAATGTARGERTSGVDWVPKFGQGVYLKIIRPNLAKMTKK
ncbi:hypothetical protein FOIG_12147 [Fusarium odoratissimum NRRL 54006]|uniref:Uncharacterized protein n=2 Tax=Fusarium oxysporum species complex TaxID=171631 RepID=X0JFF6_FUSO5|nr:uncharacterized protein FOIG_12147 [Fusarium odoratissimum NRRL 54006]EXL95121.1 hypothetical protein FOIG_12147 [Fusarium odoratissimum NRRL 54006]TXC09452.1 hypothetical protein FocTR4_00005278 [Fusarium oxysporum f. sp. cubense]